MHASFVFSGARSSSIGLLQCVLCCHDHCVQCRPTCIWSILTKSAHGTISEVQNKTGHRLYSFYLSKVKMLSLYGQKLPSLFCKIGPRVDCWRWKWLSLGYLQIPLPLYKYLKILWIIYSNSSQLVAVLHAQDTNDDRKVNIYALAVLILFQSNLETFVAYFNLMFSKYEVVLHCVLLNWRW